MRKLSPLIHAAVLILHQTEKILNLKKKLKKTLTMAKKGLDNYY